jgi:hypothetical protein
VVLDPLLLSCVQWTLVIGWHILLTAFVDAEDPVVDPTKMTRPCVAAG